MSHPGAEALVQLLVPALAQEVEVELAEGGEERVRVAGPLRAPVGVRHLELVRERERRIGDAPGEDALGVDAAKPDRLATLGHDGDPIGAGAIGAHDHAPS